MTWGLRALVGLPKEPGSVPHRAANKDSSRSRGSSALFCPLWALHACGALAYMYVKTFIHTENKTFL